MQFCLLTCCWNVFCVCKSQSPSAASCTSLYRKIHAKTHAERRKNTSRQSQRLPFDVFTTYSLCYKLPGKARVTKHSPWNLEIDKFVSYLELRTLIGDAADSSPTLSSVATPERACPRAQQGIYSNKNQHIDSLTLSLEISFQISFRLTASKKLRKRRLITVYGNAKPSSCRPHSTQDRLNAHMCKIIPCLHSMHSHIAKHITIQARDTSRPSYIGFHISMIFVISLSTL